MNRDENCLRWIRITTFYDKLRKAFESGETDLFEGLIENAENYTMFDPGNISSSLYAFL